MNDQILRRNILINKISSLQDSISRQEKETLIFELFDYQYDYNTLYKDFCLRLGKDKPNVHEVPDIPLLPISSFKHHVIKTGDWIPETVFKSSGTMQKIRSNHFIRDVNFYHNHSQKLWENHFGSVDDYCFLALLPGYTDRGESSLVSMIQRFISKTERSGSSFVQGKEYVINDIIKANTKKNIKTVLFGVSFALLELLEKNMVSDKNLIVMETGGMKGLREDMTKEELLKIIKRGFGTEHVFSEFGMTELLSQAYTRENTFFTIPDCMEIRIKQLQDPLEEEVAGKQGILGCIDLANIDTCGFILTEDAGLVNANNEFQLTGRIDNADIRGCNLLMADLM
ncbi:MAG: acyl transferase [Saprospiraceae bacterium]|nr:acyl transferase [Saprospiraceae bacterium]MBK8854671.1 acyl transferase [Saprospiraceae bacterium]